MVQAFVFRSAMTSPSLQDVLAAAPHVADSIDAMTELIPGVPASKQNLKTLLEHVMKEKHFIFGKDVETIVQIFVTKKKK